MIYAELINFGSLQHKEADKVGAGAGNYNYVIIGSKTTDIWYLQSAYCYHDDAASSHNVTAGIKPQGDNVYYLTETLRAKDERHWLHSADGDGQDPSIWIAPLIVGPVTDVYFRGHGIPANKKLYAKILCWVVRIK